MADTNSQHRLDRLEHNVEKLKEVFTTQIRTEVATVEERFAKKNDTLDQALAILMERQEKLIEMGVPSRLESKDITFLYSGA